MAKKTPRVLIITNNKIQSYTGGGVVLSNLFHQFRSEDMFFLHSDTYPSPEGTHYLGHQLSKWELRPDPLNAIKILKKWMTASPNLAVSFTDKIEWRKFVFGVSRFKFSKDVKEAISRFSPDIIYSWVGDLLSAHLLEDALREFRLPYILHFMDNHVEVTGNTPLDRVLHEEFKQKLDGLVAGSEKIFTISSAMGNAYKKIFKKEFEVFHGLIDSKTWSWTEPQKHPEKFRIGFTGSVEAGQLMGLKDVFQAVVQLVAEGHEIALDLYLTEFYEARTKAVLGSPPGIYYHRHPDFQQLRGVLHREDVLLLAYGFDPASVQYYRYSFPTKVVPYMMSGRCILAYGPASIEPINYLEREGWAKIVNEPGVESLCRSILELKKSSQMRDIFAKNAFNAAFEEHDLDINSHRFKDSLASFVRR